MMAGIFSPEILPGLDRFQSYFADSLAMAASGKARL
jgi:hypothetical protein